MFTWSPQIKTEDSVRRSSTLSSQCLGLSSVLILQKSQSILQSSRIEREVSKRCNNGSVRRSSTLSSQQAETTVVLYEHLKCKSGYLYCLSVFQHISEYFTSLTGFLCHRATSDDKQRRSSILLGISRQDSNNLTEGLVTVSSYQSLITYRSKLCLNAHPRSRSDSCLGRSRTLTTTWLYFHPLSFQ